MKRTLYLVIILFTITDNSYAEPDVVINRLDYASHVNTTQSGNISLSVGTDSCNVGTTELLWDRFPATTHPVITANLYRYHEGRLLQLSSSWVKHGFFATNLTPCYETPNRPANCSAPPGADGQSLYPGCTDLYPAELNAAESWLGPRSKINPTTGKFASDARDVTGYPIIDVSEKVMNSPPNELSIIGASYFVEGIYITNDDALAKNSRNNMTYKKVVPTPAGLRWEFPDDPSIGMTHFEPIVNELKKDGALVEEVKTEEVPGYDSYIFVTSNVIEKNGIYRYEYLIYNLNSDLAIQSFSLPATSIIAGSTGSHMPKLHGELWESDNWNATQTDSSLTWATRPYNSEPNSSAIRWGVSQSFWFSSTKAPERKTATLNWFKPFSPQTFSANVLVPGR